MRVAVIDGQGGGIGKHIVEKIRHSLSQQVEVVALGTNALATAQMLKAGANEGATGENAIHQTAAKVDVIIGSVSILVANSMLGELTPTMARAIGESTAVKILLPINRAKIEIVGTGDEPLPHQIDNAVRKLNLIIKGEITDV